MRGAIFLPLALVLCFKHSSWSLTRWVQEFICMCLWDWFCVWIHALNSILALCGHDWAGIWLTQCGYYKICILLSFRSDTLILQKQVSIIDLKHKKFRILILLLLSFSLLFISWSNFGISLSILLVRLLLFWLLVWYVVSCLWAK